MKKTIFSQVKYSLKSLHQQEPTGHRLKRLNSLSGLVTGMIRRKSSHLPDIGSGLPQDINAASRVIHAKRFLSNKWIDYETYYFPFLSAFLENLLGKAPISKGVRLVIDGSQMGSKHVALVVSLVWKKRSIPICWFIRKGKKGHFPEQMHIDIIKEAANILHSILSPKTKITLLGDGEFDGTGLQKLCRQILGWNYISRTASNRILYENEDLFKPKYTHIAEGETYLLIPSVDFSKNKFPDVNFLHWHHPDYTDPIFLISNLDDPLVIMDYYQLRFSIETMFKDLKSRGFNLHKTRLKDASCIFNLLIVGALCFCFITGLGYEHQNSSMKKKVQEKKNQQLSIFSLGLAFFHYFIEREIPFVFSLIISKNSS